MIVRPLSIRRALFPVFTGALGLLGVLSVGCAHYSLQTSKTNSLKDIGVQRIYVAPVKNISYKPGVENIVYNELIEVLLAGGRVKVADQREDADAILEASVDRASYAPSATTDATSIYPTTVAAIQITVATEYQADVLCTFHLRRLKNGGTGDLLWEAPFSRTRRFAGNNQKVVYGTTAGLINESEFDRTLREIAHGMMQDVHQSLVSRF